MGAAASALPAAAQIATPQGEMSARQEVRRGVTIAYGEDWFGAPWADGAPLMLLHGVAESRLAWQQWVPLVAAKFRVIRPDLPGFGQSPLPAGYDCAPKTIAADLVRLMDAKKIDRFHLIGAKVGGSVALQLAADFPDRVRSLAVFGTPVTGTGRGGKSDPKANEMAMRKEGVRAWAAKGMRARLGSEASDAMMQWWTDELMGKSGIEACLAYTAADIDMNLKPLLKQIKAPTLVVTTESSALQPVATAREYQEMIPHSKLLVLPGDSYHVAAVHPDICARQAMDFIATA